MTGHFTKTVVNMKTLFLCNAVRTLATIAVVALGDHPYVRLGVNPTSGSDAPTMVQLKYKAGTNSWETLTMELEQRGDGWQPKFDGNDYYTSFIPTNKFEVGMTVQYYFYVEYTNSSMFAVTSVGTTGQRGSIAYLGPNEAKSHPYQFTVVASPNRDDCTRRGKYDIIYASKMKHKVI